MKIMLLFPSWTSEYGIAKHFGRKTATWPPLNLAILAAIAEQEGHEVRIIDGQAEDMSLAKMVEQTSAFKPDIIGITGATPFYHMAIDLASELKKILQTPIVIGGAHITILKRQAFEPCFDYGFIGEADTTFPMFLRYIETGRDISGIKGILFRQNGKVQYTGSVVRVQDINSIPFPARHLLKMDKYKIGTLRGTKNFTSIMFSRGCPFNCIFCSTKVFGKQVRRRSARSVVEEITSVVSNFSIRHFIFADDNLTLDKNYILELCELIREARLSITFEGGTRANLVDEEIVAAMAKAGMIRLSFGLESVDLEVRRIMRKEVPLESYGIANKLLNKYNIECLNTIMIGMPGDTHKTINKTLSYLKHSHDIKQANSSIAVPYPGTELYEMAKKGEHGLKLITEDYSKYIRYGSAVMQVGDLTPNDLIKIQNKTFLSIYSAYWRWIPILKRGGLINIVLTLGQLIKSMMHIMFNGKK